MPELIEQMYCSQQIVIPPKYPYILKRYCKAAIKTQPYDLLRWSFEYFKALAEHRPPPVKLRLEYPIYSTEGGLTRGCLKVLAHQLYVMKDIPIYVLKQAWQGFCLDRIELRRILCLCEVYLREESVPFFHFVAVAGGMLTKCLTHTMILLCETLTKEPDGGSAAVPVDEFLKMYRYLAVIDASKDVQYHNGYREGFEPPSVHEEEEESTTSEKKLKEMSSMMMAEDKDNKDEKPVEEAKDAGNKDVTIFVFDEEEKAVEYEIYGEPKEEAEDPTEESEFKVDEETAKEEEVVVLTEADKVQEFLAEVVATREERIKDLEKTFEEIAALVDKFNTANYDLGMVAGRQMSTTSGEFIVQHIEKEIMDYINEQIAILPDPDLKKKKAKPEEVAMVRELVDQFFDDNMDVIIPEIEEVEEEEEPIPEITMVYAVPGIGGTVDTELIEDFVEYIMEVCKVQAETVMPRNIRHFLCPPLEKYIEPDYAANDVPPKEEVATGCKDNASEETSEKTSDSRYDTIKKSGKNY